MNAHEYLSEDGHVLLSLCSSFALALSPTPGAEAVPFKLSEWNELSRKIASSTLGRPAALVGKNASELSESLRLTGEEAERIVRLLDRAGRLAIGLDLLFSRGLWVVTRVDRLYPMHLRQTLKHQAPSVLFGSGDIRRLCQPGVAIVGSRNIDEAATSFAQETGRKCAAAKIPIISGGARGSDRVAMAAAIEADGIVFGVLADSLERTVRQPDIREFLLDQRLVLITPYVPTAGFSVGAAMGRNKVIYGLANYGIVVSSDVRTGGTWAGAMEAIKGGWCPIYVRDSEAVPAGNKELLKSGGLPLPANDLSNIDDMGAWLAAHVTRAAERDLFGFSLRDAQK